MRPEHESQASSDTIVQVPEPPQPKEPLHGSGLSRIWHIFLALFSILSSFALELAHR